MTFEERGAYVTLLVEQAQTGPLPEKKIKRLLRSDYEKLWPEIADKFVQDSDGNYYNKKMMVEVESIVAYCASRSANRQKSKTKKNNICSSYDKHMGDGNGNGYGSGSKGGSSTLLGAMQDDIIKWTARLGDETLVWQLVYLAVVRRKVKNPAAYIQSIINQRDYSRAREQDIDTVIEWRDKVISGKGTP